MLNTRVVPWINYDEYEQVYTWLFADRTTEVESIQRGIDRVQTWTNRGEIPSSVEMTAAFIEIIIRDEKLGQQMSHKELRLMYAMAIIRFVNGLVDREQKGRFARSIQTLARSLGLPSWFVDLRHASTHEHLPNLTVLRTGAIQAVGWLHDNYWTHNIKHENKSKHNPEVKQKLNQYKECRKSFIKEKYSGNKNDPNPYVECIQSLIEIIDEEDIAKDIIPLLLGVGGLVPTGKKKRALADDMVISKGLIELWTPLIQGLDVGFPRFGNILIENIIKKLDTNYDFVVNESLLNPYSNFAIQNKDDPTKASSYLLTLTCWLRHFVTELGTPAHDRSLSHISIDDILEGCLRNPNYYTRSVLQSISTMDPELGQSIKPFTRYIDQIIMKSIDNKKAQRLEQTEEELANELTELESQLVNIKSTHYKLVKKQPKKQIQQDMMEIDTEECAWKLCENWKPCPIGTLANGNVPCLDMSVLMKNNIE